jgi:carbonic anhydrase/acetyltransferase-like protein (isoleucine patch superfamily)
MILDFDNIKPTIHEDAFIAHSADIIGRVRIEKDASIWFGTVVRGDINQINILEGSNIQDNSVIHVDEKHSVNIGRNVTVGHGVILHGCTIEENCLIGMGSVILNGAKIGNNTIVAAGSLIAQNKEIPSGVLCMGSPAKVVRDLTEEEIESIRIAAKKYIETSKKYFR